MTKGWKIAAAFLVAFCIVLSDGALRQHADAQTAEKLSWQGRHALVRYQNVQNPSWTYDENVWTIRAAADRFNVSRSIMLCIARRESGDGLDETAYNSGSGASGLYQHLRRYWAGRVDFYNARVGKWLKVQPNASPFSARANALVSARMMHTGGFGPWAGEGCST